VFGVLRADRCNTVRVSEGVGLLVAGRCSGRKAASYGKGKCDLGLGGP
jgi:hypothetical protein